MVEKNNDLYIESKISEKDLKKKTNEEKRLKICKRNNLLSKYLLSQKEKCLLFKIDPWNDIYQKGNLKTFLTSSKHVETLDIKYGMNKLFIYNFLYNYELNDIPKHVSEFMIDRFFNNIEKKEFSEQSFSSIDSEEKNIEEYLNGENEIEKEFFHEYHETHISTDLSIQNEFNNFVEEKENISKLDNLTTQISKEIIVESKNILKEEVEENEQKNTKNNSVKKHILSSRMDSKVFVSNMNKIKQTYNNESIEETIEKINNKKKLLENFFSQNTYIDKKLEILRFMKVNNIECFSADDFDVEDGEGNKLISQENIDHWYASFKNIETRKKTIFNPSLIIMSAVLFSVEQGAKFFNIKEFEGISKNFSEKTVPQDLLSTKEYLDEHISSHMPKNPFFDFGIYLVKTFFEKKLSL